MSESCKMFSKKIKSKILMMITKRMFHFKAVGFNKNYIFSRKSGAKVRDEVVVYTTEKQEFFSLKKSVKAQVINFPFCFQVCKKSINFMLSHKHKIVIIEGTFVGGKNQGISKWCEK